jgi:PBP1b-binding outer membrane lipoprotein LpoB
LGKEGETQTKEKTMPSTKRETIQTSPTRLRAIPINSAPTSAAVAPIEGPIDIQRARNLLRQAEEETAELLTELLSELDQVGISLANVTVQLRRARNGQLWADVHITSEL